VLLLFCYFACQNDDMPSTNPWGIPLIFPHFSAKGFTCKIWGKKRAVILGVFFA